MDESLQTPNVVRPDTYGYIVRTLASERLDFERKDFLPDNTVQKVT